jgi:penicillin-binding protein 1B
VYASPTELYVGAPLTVAGLEAELGQLAYAKRDAPERPGTYRRNGGRFDVAARAAQFADESRPAQIVRITVRDGAVSALATARGEALPVFRLDPLLIGSIFPIHGEDRIVLAPDEVPALLPAAIKAVEDRKFEDHHGLDWRGILRAAIANLRAGKIEQGGSTLTQQLVKSYFLDERRTFGRKAREAVMAIALERRYTKADLMNAYVNEIYLGQDGQRAVHGFGLASRFWFGKPLTELDLAGTALLVGLARGPSYYDPRRRPERALARRNLVLKLLAEQGVVDADAARRASEQPLGVLARPSGGYYPAYLDFVRRTLRRDYREEDLTEGGLTIHTSFEPRAQSAAERAIERELARLDEDLPRAAGTAPLEAAAVVAIPSSGEVIAMVGGRQVGFDGFNRALDAKRPIGSLVKPFVYLTAFERGEYTATSIVQDAPIEVRLSRTQTWKPQNFTRQAYGPVPVVRALGDSLNLATVRVGLDVGVERVIETLSRFGLPEKPPARPALLLGALDLATLDVAQLYNGLANGGFQSPLRAVRTVVGEDGIALKSYPVNVAPVASPDTVYEVVRILTQVVEHGTSRAARIALPPGLVVAGKTGSSSDLRDSWFAGFSGSHLAVVWVGYDDNRPTGVTGSAGALYVWSRLMAALPNTSWQAALPDSLDEVEVDYGTGLRVIEDCVDDPATVAVPRGQLPPYRADCGVDPGGRLGDRVGDFLRGIIGR